MSKTQQVFGSSADSILQWSLGSAKSFGQSRQQALDAASTFGIFGHQANLTGSDLSNFSTKLTELASDLASFSNTSPQDAILALSSALQGEAEPIRAYGVLLDEATLKARALSEGILKAKVDSLDVASAQKKLSDAQDKYNEMLTKTTPSLAEVSDAELGVREASQHSEDAARALTKARAAQAEANRSTRVSVEDLARAEANVTAAENTVSNATKELNDLRNRTLTSTRLVHDAELSLAEAKLGSESAISRLNDANRDYRDLLKDQGDQLDRVNDAELSLAESKQRLTEATERFTEAQRTSVVDTDKVAEAEDNLQRAQNRAATATLKSADALAIVQRFRSDSEADVQDRIDAEEAYRSAADSEAEALKAVDKATKDLETTRTTAPTTATELSRASLEVERATRGVQKSEEALAASRESQAATPEERAAAERAIAQARIDQENATTRASDAQAKLDQLRSPAAITAQQLASAEDAVTAAQNGLASAQTNLSTLRAAGTRDTQAIADAEAAVANAQLNVERTTRESAKAQADLDAVRNPAITSAKDLEAAQLAVSQATDALNTAGTIGQLTPAERVMAVYAEVMAQTSLQQGDFDRTATGAANSSRIWAAEVDNLKTNVGNGLQPVITESVPIIGSLIDLLGVSAVTAINVLRPFITELFEWLGPKIKAAIDEGQPSLANWVHEFAENLVTKMQNFLPWFRDEFIPGVKDFWNKLNDVNGTIREHLAPALDGMYQRLQDGLHWWRDNKDLIGGAADSVWDFLGGVAKTTTELGVLTLAIRSGNPYVALGAAIAVAGTNLYDYLKNNKDFKEWWNGFKDDFNRETAALWANIQRIPEKIGEFFSGLNQTAVNWAVDLIGGIKRFFVGDSNGGGLQSTMESPFINFINTVEDLPRRAGNAIIGIGNKIGELGGFIWNSMLVVGKNLVNPFLQGLNVLISAWNAFKLELRVPDNVPWFGGKGFTIDTPNFDTIPYLADGGDVTRGGSVLVGEAGPEILSLPAGASVNPLSGNGSVGGGVVTLKFDTSGGVDKLGALLQEWIYQNYGGNVVSALGSGNG